MKKLLSFIITLVLMAPAAMAQDVNIEQVDANDNSDLESHTENFGNWNIFSTEDLTSVFTQSDFISGIQRRLVDANQVAKIRMEGNNNSARLEQTGSSNIGVININGSGNETSLTQMGSGLLSAIKINGNTNDLDVTQNGDNLQNLIVLDGAGLNFDVRQTESGVELMQTGSSIPLQIESSGNRIPIFISNN